MTHILRTLENAKILAKMLNINDSYTDNLLSACVLHDIGYARSIGSHAMLGAIECKAILKRYNYTAENIEIISSAISSHNSFDISNYDFDISIIVMLADKLDVSELRYNKYFETQNNSFNGLMLIEYTSFRSINNGIEICLNCKPTTTDNELIKCPLINKLDAYLDIASRYLKKDLKLNIKIRKALTKI